jgi:NAD(P)-dependent dehydrogenase (short-subunit alcohol dehydrogenase family)
VGDESRIALITGASRGIGKAIAVALAGAGLDVVVTARTVREGEGRWEPQSAVGSGETTVAPGSLETTAGEIEARGQRALVVPMDLLDRATIERAVTTALVEWGRIDVLVNNAIYQGAGMMERLLDLPIELAETMVVANYVNQLYLVQLLLPGMLERGAGMVVDVTSGAGQYDPFMVVGEGGWGIGYGASKSAWHRVAPFVHVEHGAQGIRAFNVDPGFVLTETVRLSDAGATFRDRLQGAPPEVIGAAVAWLVTDPDAQRFLGRTVDAQRLAADRALVPGWPPSDAA